MSKKENKKKIDLYNNWSRNKINLPKCNYVLTNDEANILKDEEEKNKKKKEVINLLIEEKNKFIKGIKMPEIDDHLKKEREKKIKALDDPSSHTKYTMKKQKQNRILFGKRNNSKPSKFKWELKLEEPVIDKFEEDNKNILKKPKRMNLSPIVRTKLIPDKKPDYLREIINKKEEKKNKSMSNKNKEEEEEEEELYINQKSKKWEKAINNNNGTLIENINSVKQKANILEKDAAMKERLLKISGGIESNPELGKQVSNLLIDSIEAKLSILKKIGKA